MLLRRRPRTSARLETPLIDFFSATAATKKYFSQLPARVSSDAATGRHRDCQASRRYYGRRTAARARACGRASRGGENTRQLGHVRRKRARAGLMPHQPDEPSRADARPSTWKTFIYIYHRMPGHYLRVMPPPIDAFGPCLRCMPLS